MILTYLLGLIADHDAETAGTVIYRVWAALEKDPAMAKRLRKAAAVEESNTERIAAAFREVTGLPLLPNPLSYAQGFAIGVGVSLIPPAAVKWFFDSEILDDAVEFYWGLKRDHGDSRGRELFETLIDAHKAEFALFKTRRHLRRVA